MKAEVDKDLCIGCGLCPELSEGMFKLNDEGKAEVVFEPIPTDKEQYVKEAEYACPVNAIRSIM